jgi:hypothetical protein
VNTLINRIADKALGLVLPEAPAGACIPGTGTVCKCVKTDYCEPTGEGLYEIYLWACNGTCVYHVTECGICRVGT